mmetsp:Transcript_9666/g.18785  ORF Transcript_9666/g.18785 Transcript_9666/m.18785 type:complete len:782 (+) Transcript_9666:110-2455(+)
MIRRKETPSPCPHGPFLHFPLRGKGKDSGTDRDGTENDALPPFLWGCANSKDGSGCPAQSPFPGKNKEQAPYLENKFNDKRFVEEVEGQMATFSRESASRLWERAGTSPPSWMSSLDVLFPLYPSAELLADSGLETHHQAECGKYMLTENSAKDAVRWIQTLGWRKVVCVNCPAMHEAVMCCRWVGQYGTPTAERERENEDDAMSSEDEREGRKRTNEEDAGVLSVGGEGDGKVKGKGGRLKVTSILLDSDERLAGYYNQRGYREGMEAAGLVGPSGCSAVEKKKKKKKGEGEGDGTKLEEQEEHDLFEHNHEQKSKTECDSNKAKKGGEKEKGHSSVFRFNIANATFLSQRRQGHVVNKEGPNRRPPPLSLSRQVSALAQIFGPADGVVIDVPAGMRFEFLFNSLYLLALSKKLFSSAPHSRKKGQAEGGGHTGGKEGEAKDALRLPPVIFFVPWMLEGRLMAEAAELRERTGVDGASFKMLDFPVHYVSNPFMKRHKKGGRGRVEVSPVRPFTNVEDISKLCSFGETQKYRDCLACRKKVHTQNRHCDACGKCVSTDRQPRSHCDACGVCVPKHFEHCGKCASCFELRTHTCKAVEGGKLSSSKVQKQSQEKRKKREDAGSSVEQEKESKAPQTLSGKEDKNTEGDQGEDGAPAAPATGDAVGRGPRQGHSKRWKKSQAKKRKKILQEAAAEAAGEDGKSPSGEKVKEGKKSRKRKAEGECAEDESGIPGSSGNEEREKAGKTLKQKEDAQSENTDGQKRKKQKTAQKNEDKGHVAVTK